MAASAYRSGTELVDERTGKTENYKNRREHVAYSEILLPDEADEKFKNREYLWNKVEAAEDKYNTRRSQAQVAKDCILALPRDEGMTHADHVELARRFSWEHFVKHGLVADINIHYDDVEEDDSGEEGGGAATDSFAGKNPHAHIMVTTRRLIGDEFDRKKARDLDPKVIRGRVDPDKVWHDEWRTMQNTYFLEKDLKLEVDPSGLVNQVHLGKATFHSPYREKTNHWQENEARKKASLKVLLTDPEAILNRITLRQSTFTQADMAKLIDRLLSKEKITDPSVFQTILIKVQASRSLIKLGPGVDGKDYFTTRAMFEAENDVQDFADYLKQQHHHGVSNRLMEDAIKQSTLQDDQSKAVRYLVDGCGIRAMVAPAGTGKSYTLGVARDIWIQSGFRVHGVALSSKLASNLSEKSTINSRTIEALRYGLRQGYIKLTKKDVVVMDKASMADAHAYREILHACARAGAKFVYVGDPGQTGAIGPEAMRALLERTGYIELTEVHRQKVVWQREATYHFANDRINDALDVYHEHGNIHFGEKSDTVMKQLVGDWHQSIEEYGLSSSVIIAHAHPQIDALNTKARQARIDSGKLKEGISILTSRGPLNIAVGERIQLLKNSRDLGIMNGDFATVEKWARDRKGKVLGLEIRLDGQPDQTVMLNLSDYDALDYGYAAAVNKAQEVDHAFTYVSGWGWNKHLAYVSQTRHKQSATMYVDQASYQDMDALKRGMRRELPKDSLYDWPWLFRERRAMPVNDSVIARFKHHLTKRLKTLASQLRDQHEERFAPKVYRVRKQREAKLAKKDEQTKTQYRDATHVYDYTEAAKKSGHLWHRLFEDKERIEDRFDKKHEIIDHHLYREALEALAVRDAKAFELLSNLSRYEVTLAHYHIDIERLEKQAASSTGREVVKQYVEECKKERALHRDRLAYEISQDSARFAAGMSYHEGDWSALRDHARAHERRALLKKLSKEERQMFSVVEKYIEAYWGAAKLWGQYFELKGKGIKGEELIDLAESAQQASDQRNQLALTIHRDKASYRIGLTFYHIEKAEHVQAAYLPHSNKARSEHVAEDVFAKREVKLNRYAHQGYARERVSSYLQSKDPVEKSKLADTILHYPGFHNRYIAASAKDDKDARNKLYQALHHDAISLRREKLVKKLSAEEQSALLVVDEYQRLSQSIRSSWEAFFNQGKSDKLVTKINQVSEKRDALAIFITQDLKRYKTGLSLYEIKPEHLNKSIQAQACRDRVATWMDSSLNLEEKIALADFIVRERRSHIQAVQTAGLDWRTIYPYADMVRHQTLYQSLDLMARSDFMVVSRYARLRQRLARVMANKRKNNIAWTPKQQQHFDRLSALRNQLADQLLDDGHRYATYIDAFRLTPNKLQKHANLHITMVTQLRVYKDERIKLITTLNALVKEAGSLDKLAEHQSDAYLQWREQCEQVAGLSKRWLYQGHRIHHALETLDMTELQLKQDVSLLKTIDNLVRVKLGHDTDYQEAVEKAETIHMPQPVQLQGGQRRWDAKVINERLNEQAEEVAMAAVHPEETFNAKLSNGSKLVWGKKNGSLHVSISGPHVGRWNDFSSSHDKGNNLLSFIQLQQGLSFKDAIDWAVRFLGLGEPDMTWGQSPKTITVKEQKKISDKALSEDMWKKIHAAREYWQGSQPILGTLAERYLREHRAISGDLPNNYRFHPRVWNFDTKKYYPALMVGATNEKGEIQAVQAIFLDKDSSNKISKEETALRKWSRGVFLHASVWLNGYDQNKPVAIIEGPETAASILEAKGNDWNIDCSCGANNFKNVYLPKTTKSVILVLDNDINNKKTEKNAIDAANYYADQGIDVWFAKPNTPGDDFNDIHQREGLVSVKTLLDHPVLHRKGLNAEKEIQQLQSRLVTEEKVQQPTTLVEWQREARRLAFVGQMGMAIDVLGKHELLHTLPTQTKAITRLLKDWVSSYHGISSATLLCNKLNDCKTLNDGARFLLKRAGKIKALHQLKTHEGMKEFGIGDTVCFSVAWDKKAIAKNTLAKIMSIQEDRVNVRLENNRRLTFKLSEYRSLDYGYALTTEQAKGKAFAKGFTLVTQDMHQTMMRDTLLLAKRMDIYYSVELFNEYETFKKQLSEEPKPTIEQKQITEKPLKKSIHSPKKRKGRQYGPDDE